MHASFLNDLAVELSNRFKHEKDMKDLDEAIKLHRQALEYHIPPDHRLRYYPLSNLAADYSTRFQALGKTEDFKEAVAFTKQALCTSFPQDRSRPLHNLAHAILFARSKKLQEKDMEDVIRYCDQALELYPREHPSRFTLLNNLAGGIFTSRRRLSCESSAAELEKAIRYYREALTLCSKEHPDYSLLLCNLASCCFERSKVNKEAPASRAYLNQSFALFREAAFYPSGDLAAKLEVAYKWLFAARRHKHFSRGDAYVRVMYIRERLIATSPDVHAQFERLITLRPTDASDAAADAIQRGNRTHAVELLEQGRAILWARMRGSSPLIYTQLRHASAEGPIIIVNVSAIRSDAIIIHNIWGLTTVPLPKHLPKMLASLVLQLSRAQSLDTDASRTRTIVSILRDLWKNIVSPVVVSLLSEFKVNKKTRIWWCPTSHLCALPLHAAGPYNGTDENLPDLFISSYTPSLAALITARENIQPPAPNRLLVIGQQTKSLPTVKEEVCRILEFSGNVKVGVLFGETADRETVLSNLRSHNWVHFACHGHRRERPFDSSFELRDSVYITLLDLIEVQRPEAEFAFLSACHTAGGVAGAPDEVIHLAAAMLFSGFRSVVGTMWAMADIDGPLIAKEFYGHMFRNEVKCANFKDSAEALNKATQAMRQMKIPVHRWINLIHIGA